MVTCCDFWKMGWGDDSWGEGKDVLTNIFRWIEWGG